MAVTEADKIAERLDKVRSRIREAALQASRPADSVELIAVSKKHSVASIEAAYEAGQRVFGESYVDELEFKVAHTKHLSDIEFRFIGHLQSNKAKRATKVCRFVDSVHSAKLARALSRHAESTINVLIQVNVLGEASKAGVAPSELDALVNTIAELPKLELDGFMVIPPPDLEQTTYAFMELAALAKRHKLRTLSMGMSGDLEVAIACGSTQVRVGTGIFGPRPS